MTFDFLAELKKIAGQIPEVQKKPAQTYAELEAERLKKWQRDYYLAGLERQKQQKKQ